MRLQGSATSSALAGAYRSGICMRLLLAACKRAPAVLNLPLGGRFWDAKTATPSIVAAIISAKPLRNATVSRPSVKIAKDELDTVALGDGDNTKIRCFYLVQFGITTPLLTTFGIYSNTFMGSETVSL